MRVETECANPACARRFILERGAAEVNPKQAYFCCHPCFWAVRRIELRAKREGKVVRNTRRRPRIWRKLPPRKLGRPRKPLARFPRIEEAMRRRVAEGRATYRVGQVLSLREQLYEYIRHRPETPAEACWEWEGPLTEGDNGYGVYWHEKEQCTRRVHVLMYELEYGPVPAGLFVLHKCDNTKCARPSHLYTGKHKQNMIDYVIRGRKQNKLTRGEECDAARAILRGENKQDIAARMGASGFIMTRIAKRLADPGWYLSWPDDIQVLLDNLTPDERRRRLPPPHVRPNHPARKRREQASQ